MTGGPFLLDWDDRGALRNPVWGAGEPPTVNVELYTIAPPGGRAERDFDYWLGLEDSSLTRSCP